MQRDKPQFISISDDRQIGSNTARLQSSIAHILYSLLAYLSLYTHANFNYIYIRRLSILAVLIESTWDIGVSLVMADCISQNHPRLHIANVC